MLFAGPYVGELGYELFCWHGRLRHIATHEIKLTECESEWLPGTRCIKAGYEPIVVACRRGHEILYQDFAEEIISVDIQTPDALRSVSDSYQVPAFEEIFQRPQNDNTWIKPNEVLIAYSWRHQPIHPQRSEPEQQFVRFGRCQEYGYDLLIHARNRSQSPERNYRQWTEVVKHWDGLALASVGSQEGADHIPGTDDLRGLSLGELADVMASSVMIVGPSSGPMHFAALCDLFAVTWFGHPYDARNCNRYFYDWNPLDAGVAILADDTWQPPPKMIAEEILAGLKPVLASE